MNLGDLRRRLRGPMYLRDHEPPYNYEDETLDWGLNEALREAAVRASLTRADRVEIPLTAGEPLYGFPAGMTVLEVLKDRVCLASNPDLFLEEYSLRARAGVSLLRGLGTGTPRFYALDVVQAGAVRAIRFDPVPVAADTALLDVVRLPRPLVNDADVPEVPPVWHPDLLDWAAHLALGDPTLDTFDAGRSKLFADKFEAKFGPRLSAAELQRRQTDEPLAMIVE